MATLEHAFYPVNSAVETAVHWLRSPANSPSLLGGFGSYFAEAGMRSAGFGLFCGLR